MTGISRPSSVPGSAPNGIGSAGTSTNPQGTAAEPISTGNGNYFYQHTDLSVAHHIAFLPLAFQRTYNSLDTYRGPLGTNWMYNFQITVATTMSNGNASGAVVKWGDGHGETFTLSNGIYVPATGVTNSLVSDPKTGTYTLTRKDGVQYLFSWDGILQSVQNTNGLYINVSRDANNNITALDPLSLGLSFSLTIRTISSPASPIGVGGQFLMLTMQITILFPRPTPAGNETQYAYDSSNRLKSVTLPNKSVLVQNTYDSSSRVISQTNARGYITTLAYNTPAQGRPPSPTLWDTRLSTPTTHPCG